MGYFLLRESMLDSLIRARDKYLKPKTGIMFPSHCEMYWAPINDKEERLCCQSEYVGSMGDWQAFVENTKDMYGVDMKCLEERYHKEQDEYYNLSSRWAELPHEAVLAEPCMLKRFDMATCTIQDSKGILPGNASKFSFADVESPVMTEISGFAGWFTADFKSRTDDEGKDAPKVDNPVNLTTAPGPYTHWGQQVFGLKTPMILLPNEKTTVEGELEMYRCKTSARLYNVKVNYESFRMSKCSCSVLNRNGPVEIVYQMP